MIICDVCGTKTRDQFPLHADFRSGKISEICVKCGQAVNEHMAKFIEPIKKTIADEAKRVLAQMKREKSEFEVKGEDNASD